MNQKELTQTLCKLFVKFWMLDDPCMRPKDEVIFAQASLWADEAQSDEDFKCLDHGEWEWLLSTCRISQANSRGARPVPTWASLCAFRKTQSTRESLHKHREKPDQSRAIETTEKQSPDALALQMLEDDLAAFLTARDLGRDVVATARGASVVDACAKLASQGLAHQVGELFDRLGVDEEAKKVLSSLKASREAI